MNLRYSLLASFLSIALTSLAWGPDLQIDTTSAPSNISTVQAANGTIYVAIPDPVAGDGIALRFYTSTDQGMTWASSTMTASGMGVPIRTKLVTSGAEVWCAYLVDDSVHVMDMNTGVVSLYPTYAAEDFDVVMSSTGWMYLYLQVRADTDIRRAGTNTAGATWTGNTALVTSNGADPRLSISPGDTIIVSYYGPVLIDEPKSIVRRGMYYESAPGTLSVSGIAFDDVITNTAIDKWQYQCVQSNGVVWMFWSQGVGSRDIRAVVSTDGGDTFGAPIDVMASTVDDEFGFHAIPTPGGVDLVFERFPTGGLTDQVYHTSASSSSPTSFTPAVEVSEHTPMVFGSDRAPQALLLNNNSIGVAWVGMDMTSDVNVYWDNDAIGTGVAETDLMDVQVYPNPTSEQLTVQVDAAAGMQQLLVRDARGALVTSSRPTWSDRHTMYVGQLPRGNYCIELLFDDGRIARSRFMKM